MAAGRWILRVAVNRDDAVALVEVTSMPHVQ